MSLRACADCSTKYAHDLLTCPHCGSSDYVDEAGPAKRLPIFVTVSCPECGRGPWTVRLASVTSGLIDLPTLACASCGSRVPVTWPPEEEPMSPKITVHGGATNARDADVSPAAAASPPLDVAEDVQGHPTSEEAADGPADVAEVEADEAPVAAADEEDEPSYAGMSLGELRAVASERGLPSYGTKAQLMERLREADS
jgi:hypothetical protein